MKINKLVGCGILIAVLVISACGNYMEKDTPELRDPAISAVVDKYNCVGQFMPIANLVERAYFSETHLYFVALGTGPEHGPCFTVAISKDGSKYVFTDYKRIRSTILGCGDLLIKSNYNDYFREQIKQFSEIQLKENRFINDSDLKKYCVTFLYLLTYNSKIIIDYSELGPLPEFKIKELSPYRDAIKPLEYTLKDGIYSLAFYSWDHRGELRRWDLDVTIRGEVVNYKSEILGTDCPIMYGPCKTSVIQCFC